MTKQSQKAKSAEIAIPPKELELVKLRILQFLAVETPPKKKDVLGTPNSVSEIKRIFERKTIPVQLLGMNPTAADGTPISIDNKFSVSSNHIVDAALVSLVKEEYIQHRNNNENYAITQSGMEYVSLLSPECHFELRPAKKVRETDQKKHCTIRQATSVLLEHLYKHDNIEIQNPELKQINQDRVKDDPLKVSYKPPLPVSVCYMGGCMWTDEDDVREQFWIDSLNRTNNTITYENRLLYDLDKPIEVNEAFKVAYGWLREKEIIVLPDAKKAEEILPNAEENRKKQASFRIRLSEKAKEELQRKMVAESGAPFAGIEAERINNRGGRAR